MEKRFVIFVVSSMAILIGFVGLNAWLTGPPDPADQQAEQQVAQQDEAGPSEAGDPDAGNPDAGNPDAPGQDGSSKEASAADGPVADNPDADNPDADNPVAAGDSTDGQTPNDTTSETTSDGQSNSPEDSADGATTPETPEAVPVLAPADPEWVIVGSFNGDAAAASPYLAYFSNRGASLVRLELVSRNKNGGFRYRNLDDRGGYPGFFNLEEVATGGCRIDVVAPGTPAAKAGLQPGDVIIKIGADLILSKEQYAAALMKTRPGDEVTFEILPQGKGTKGVPKQVQLADRPLAILGYDAEADPFYSADYGSFTVALHKLGKHDATVRSWAVEDLPSLVDSRWQVDKSLTQGDTVVFRTEIRPDAETRIELIKRFQIMPMPAEAESQPEDEPAEPSQYRIDYSVQAINRGAKAESVALRIDGPNGLPTEGWWYANKIHPHFFGSAGARDVIWNSQANGHQIRGARTILSEGIENENQPFSPIMVPNGPDASKQLRYIGVDTQYFTVAMMPPDFVDGGFLQFDEATPVALGEIELLEKKEAKLTDSSFWLVTDASELEPAAEGELSGDSVLQRKFVIFAGPKDPELLAEYRLSDTVYYGWFPWVAKPLSTILQVFYLLVRNYGIAIIMLTILVRGAMFPVSRKAAKNAQMMQELAPETKKINEKYKNDPEKKMQATRELYQKYNFNPFGGCLLMFFQLPIFLGLYRCLSVDIHLRQAALIPGLEWASNLAGPDKLWRWPLPEALAGETGWLGPYLNVLPIITIALFLIQQKLFMPPATDEQTKMQQSMMKYMMIFMGVMFFKVPAGLCIYFIASSIWGIAERKLIPKPKVNLSKIERKDGDEPPSSRRKRSKK